MNNPFNDIFRGLKILLTGHTGFKGSWLTIWLEQMGADVIGFSLPEPPTNPSNYELIQAQKYITDVRGDICDFRTIEKIIKQYQPTLIIHFAAQTTVLESYKHPRISFNVNVGGTVNLLEAIRQCRSVKAVVICATDKVYENKEWIWGYRENDELGGFDPYSTSKAMAELAVNSYRRSFFTSTSTSLRIQTAVGSVRAGNVIGGGDFTENGLIADVMRALLIEKPIYLRNPYSTRPWLYVLEALSGYLCLAGKLLQFGREFSEAWNFGPQEYNQFTTMEIVEKIIPLWGNGKHSQVVIDDTGENKKMHEAHQLHLNWDKSAKLLDWHPVYNLNETLGQTVKWYKSYQQGQDMYKICCQALAEYISRAQELGLRWAGDNRKIL